MRISLADNGVRYSFAGIGLFLLFGSSMAAVAGTMLTWPGTRLDRLWSLNETAHAELRKTGSYWGPLFFALSVILMVDAVGWFNRRMWAFRLAVAVFCTQVVGDLVNLVRGDFWRGGLGALIAGALLMYVLRSEVRTAFQQT